MRGRVALALWFSTGALGAGIARVPLGFAATTFVSEQSGFYAATASGSIWGGVLHDANLRGFALGDVRIGLQPLSLLLATPNVSVEFDRELKLSGALLLSKNFGVKRLSGELPLQLFMLERSTKLSGRVKLENVSVRFANDRCVLAEGAMSLTAQVSSQGAYWAPPPLSGVWGCASDGSAAAAALRGSAQGVDTEVLFRIQANGAYQLQTRVLTPDPATSAGLLGAGFAPGPEGFVRSDEGTL